MVTIVEVQQTPFLADAEGVLEQLIRVTVRNGGPAARGRIVYASGPSETRTGDEELFPPGDSRHEFMIPEPIEETEAELTIELGDARSAGFRTLLEHSVHWVVHVVQASHHDIGYTSLPTDVLSDHRRWLAEALEMAAATDDGPPDARFRIVLEQYWSVGDFL